MKRYQVEIWPAGKITKDCSTLKEVLQVLSEAHGMVLVTDNRQPEGWEEIASGPADHVLQKLKDHELK